jgi:hypothetical protein
MQKSLRLSLRPKVWTEQRKNSRRPGCPAAVASAGASFASTIARAVEMNFNLPYRTQFGQSLSIVGSTDDFGAWDPLCRVPMEWSDGDVWKAQVTADRCEVEYKYVIVDQTGHITEWKPGGNFEVKLQGFRGKVQIEDTWDGSLHEVKTSGTWDEPPPSAPSASVAPPPIVSAAEDPAPSFAISSSPVRSDFDDVLKQALEYTYNELQDTLDESYDLLEQVPPDDPRLLMNDQKLAAVHKKATSLSRAIDAGAPPPSYILKEIDKDERSGEATSDNQSSQRQSDL